MKHDLKSLSFSELESLVAKLNMQPFRAKQISQWIFQKNVADINSMTNLSNEVRKRLSAIAYISCLVHEKTDVSLDGSKKFLFKTSDGFGLESVLIKEENHFTLCISTQIGCSVKCRFCYTGQIGLERSLSTSEILNQVSAVLKADGLEGRLPNLVFMGMGEPFANYENTVKSIQILLSPWGFNYSHRKITVSTAGLIPRIKQLGQDLPVNLAISLNASNNKIRNFLMPINRKFPIKDLIEAARNFPISSRKRITFEYILIKDVNDSPDNALELGKLLKNIPCKINLIPFNEHPGVSFKKPPEKTIREFQSILLSKHFTVTLRRSKGSDIAAACGQLGGGL